MLRFHRHPQRHGRRRDERGQIVPIAAAFVVIFAVLAVGLAAIGRRHIDQTRAQGAADAAALAAAQSPTVEQGDRDAAIVAQRNDATIAAIRHIDGDVMVTVRLDGQQATARARPVPWSIQGETVD